MSTAWSCCDRPCLPVCPDCGYDFPKPDKPKHEDSTANGGVLSGEFIDQEWEVRDILYSVHTKKGAEETAPKTLRVDYRLGLDHFVSEGICFEHTGWARLKAEHCWAARSRDPIPTTAEEAVDRASAGALAAPDAITVRSIVGEKFERIVAYQLGPKPEPCATWAKVDLDEVPFGAE